MKQIKKYLKQAKTIPNILSFIRIALIPVFTVMMIQALSGDKLYVKKFLIAVIIFVAAGLTDLFDGKIARRFNQVTELGKVLDPVADKLTQFAVAIVLISWFWGDWLFIGMFSVYIVKEVLQLIAGFIMMKRWDHAVAARIWGKISTVVFYIAILTLFLTSEKGLLSQLYSQGIISFKLVLPDIALYIIVGISVIFMFIAFYSYIPDYVIAMNKTNQRGVEEVIIGILMALLGAFLIMVGNDEKNIVFNYLGSGLIGGTVVCEVIGIYRLKKTSKLPKIIVEESKENGEE